MVATARVEEGVVAASRVEESSETSYGQIKRCVEARKIDTKNPLHLIV